MRLRLPELLDEHDLTPYALAKASGGRISMTEAYRLSRADGHFKSVSAATLEALCDVFGVEVADLIEREPAPRRRRKGKR